MSHPTHLHPSAAELAAWANCSVPDCDGKVTHGSDKCYPHTHGWAPVEQNILRSIEELESQPVSLQRDEHLAHFRLRMVERSKHLRRPVQ